MNHQRHTQQPKQTASHIELRLIISNGKPAHDCRLKFHFSADPAAHAQVWLIRLPRIKNPEAFVTQVAAQTWELRLEVFADTQPVNVMNYTPENVAQWLANIFNDTQPGTTELLILANDGKFTVSIQQPA